MSKARRLAPSDALFLHLETPETKMHVGGLMYFTPPATAAPDFVHRIHRDLLNAHAQEPFTFKLETPRFLRSPLHRWVPDDHFDIDYHVRRSALASPGDERQLAILVSRLHSNPIDFSRPPWEVHLIEGLSGGRFAIYVKLHHSLVDGYTGIKLVQRSLSRSSDDADTPMFFSVEARTREVERHKPSTWGLLPSPSRTAQRLGGLIRSTATVAKAVGRLEARGRSDGSALVPSLSAPATVLNQRTGRNRRLATLQLDMDRLRAAAATSGGTINDVVMSVFGGGLRAYLNELDALPSKPLIAFMPVDLRAEGDAGGGNQVGAALASMGTHVADPVERLRCIIDSTTEAKKQMGGMSQNASLAYSSYLLAPFALQAAGAMLGAPSLAPATFNVCVSNLPGPREPLYFRGARLDGLCPVSISGHGAALNITCLSYDGKLNVGFVGCRDALPHLQRLVPHTSAALDALEASLRVSATTSSAR